MPVGIGNNLATRGYLSVYGGGSGPIGGGMVASILAIQETIITPEMLVGGIPFSPPINPEYTKDFKVGNKIITVDFNFNGRYIRQSLIVDKNISVRLEDLKIKTIDNKPTVVFELK